VEPSLRRFPRQSVASERVWAPAADMYETKNDVVVTAELPGLSEEGHSSLPGDDLLTVKGERQGSTDVEEGAATVGSAGTAIRSVPSRCRRRSTRADQGDLSGRGAHGEASEGEENKPKEIKIEAA